MVGFFPIWEGLAINGIKSTPLKIVPPYLGEIIVYDVGRNRQKMATKGIFHAVEPSGRLLVPADRRRILTGDTVVAFVNDLDPFHPLLLMEPNQQAGWLNGLRSLLRRLKRSAREVSAIVSGIEERAVLRRFDPSGRITLPPEMLGEAGITDNAVIVGSVSIKLLSPESWKNRQAEREGIIQELSWDERMALLDIPTQEGFGG